MSKDSMGFVAPKGNKFAVGNKGGGRPSHKETAQHSEKWWLEHDIQALEEKIASKKYSPWDVYRLRALKADPQILKNWADKVLADLHNVDVRETYKVVVERFDESESAAKLPSESSGGLERTPDPL